MSKTVPLFVFSAIVQAAVNAAESGGGFVQAVVLARQPLKGVPTEGQVLQVQTAMATAFHEKGLEASTCSTYQNYAKVLLTCPMNHLLAACEAGTGITGVLSRVRAQRPQTDAPKRGRPSGKGAGKPTATNSGAAVDPLAPNGAVKEAVSPMHYWVKELNALNAGATILRNAKNDSMTAEDAVALKNAVSTALALLGKYTA